MHSAPGIPPGPACLAEWAKPAAKMGHSAEPAPAMDLLDSPVPTNPVRAECDPAAPPAGLATVQSSAPGPAAAPTNPVQVRPAPAARSAVPRTGAVLAQSTAPHSRVSAVLADPAQSAVGARPGSAAGQTRLAASVKGSASGPAAAPTNPVQVRPARSGVVANSAVPGTVPALAGLAAALCPADPRTLAGPAGPAAQATLKAAAATETQAERANPAG